MEPAKSDPLTDEREQKRLETWKRQEEEKKEKEREGSEKATNDRVPFDYWCV